jgi:demethylmenaquinone methyltransferase/2-methoxy-6-polyprenyl-1,4-benzoquinol methylase
MFDEVSPTYDFANRVMSAGIDVLWRRRVARESGLKGGEELLDLCTGTGDVIFEFARRDPGLKGIGFDLSAKMLELARAKNRWPGIRFQKGNVLKLPWKTKRFSAVTMAYGLRSITDQVKCFKEQKRVLKKGGRVLCLELSRPANPLVRLAYWPVLNIYLPVVGRLISGHATGYQYLKDTIQGFYEPGTILGFMDKAGLKNTRAIPLTFGTATLYVGEA